MIGDMESKSIFFFSFNLQSHENNLIHLIKDVLEENIRTYKIS